MVRMTMLLGQVVQRGRAVIIYHEGLTYNIDETLANVWKVAEPPIAWPAGEPLPAPEVPDNASPAFKYRLKLAAKASRTVEEEKHDEVVATSLNDVTEASFTGVKIDAVNESVTPFDDEE